MGFPESVLTRDERVVMHLHPHARAMARPLLVLVAVLAALVACWVVLPGAGWSGTGLLALGLVALVPIGWWVVRPWLIWRAIHYVITDERVIVRRGVLARRGRDIPLSRINDISFQHSFVERLLGCGTLTIESAGERGQVVLAEVPHVERVQTRLYELAEAQHTARTAVGGDDQDLDEADLDEADLDGEPERTR